MSIKDLGIYQWEWLNKYNNINLIEWRCEIINNEKNWFYVGNWNSTEIKQLPSNNDGGYKKRYNNLKNNPYFYWKI